VTVVAGALLLSAGALAQPVVQSVAGDAIEDARLVIRGAGFGDRPDAPIAWDEFEDGSLGAAPRPSWTTWTSSPGGEPRVDNGQLRRGSARSIYCDFSGDNTESAIGIAEPLGEVWVSFWAQVRHVGTFSRNYAALRLQGGGAGDRPTWSLLYLGGDGPDGRWIAGATDDGCALEAASYGGESDAPMEERRWIRHDVWLRQSAANAVDGRMEVWRDLFPQRFSSFSAEAGEVVEVGPSVATRCGDGGWTSLRIGASWAHDPGDDAGVWLDDVYVDGSPARVEIGNGPSWAETTLAEVQPSVSWSDEAIEIEVNEGTLFRGATYWLFVFDARNRPSQGFPVQLGATIDGADAGPPPAPSPGPAGGCGCRAPARGGAMGLACALLLLAARCRHEKAHGFGHPLGRRARVELPRGMQGRRRGGR
jgi:hypothetical protein